MFFLPLEVKASLNLSGFIENHPGNRRPSNNLPLSGCRDGTGGWIQRTGRGWWAEPEKGRSRGYGMVAQPEEGYQSVNEVSDSWSGCFEGNSLRM